MLYIHDGIISYVAAELRLFQKLSFAFKECLQIKKIYFDNAE